MFGSSCCTNRRHLSASPCAQTVVVIPQVSTLQTPNTVMHPCSLLLHQYSTWKSGKISEYQIFQSHFTVRSSHFRPHICFLISLISVITIIIGQQDCNLFHHRSSGKENWTTCLLCVENLSNTLTDWSFKFYIMTVRPLGLVSDHAAHSGHSLQQLSLNSLRMEPPVKMWTNQQEERRSVTPAGVSLHPYAKIRTRPGLAVMLAS